MMQWYQQINAEGKNCNIKNLIPRETVKSTQRSDWNKSTVMILSKQRHFNCLRS